MKKWMAFLALLLALTGCSGREPAGPAEEDLPAPPQTAAVSPSLPPAPERTPEAAEPAPTPAATASPAPTPAPTPAPEAPEAPAEPSDEEVLAAYERASEAYSWFVMAPPALDREDQRTEGELTYYRVNDPRFSTLAELRVYLKGLFSDSLVDQLLPIDGIQYAELDGALYTLGGERGADITRGAETVQVLRDGTPGRCVVRVTVQVLDPEQDYAVTGSETLDFPYEQVGDRWLFTSFSAVR